MKLPIAVKFYETKSHAQSGRKCINFYPVENEGSEEFPFLLYPTPGLKSWRDHSGVNSVVRNTIVHKGILYAVIDQTLYKIDNTGTATTLGTLSTSSGDVRSASITFELCFIDEFYGYSYRTDTNTFAKITDEDFPEAPRSITAQDQYFVVCGENSIQYNLSTLNLGTEWPSLLIASKEGLSDNLVAVKSWRGFLWLMGEYSCEIWANTGNNAFPFEKQQGVQLKYGIAAADTVREANHTLMWLGRTEFGDPVVVQAEGFEIKIVSDRGINYQISLLTSLSDSYAWTYLQEGHEFYCITFPTDRKTYCYDITTDSWHERAWWNGTAFEHHLANTYAYCYGKHLVGDRRSGNIYEFSGNTYTDNSGVIRRQVVTGNLELDGRLGSISSMHVYFEPGQGLATGQGVTPVVVLEVSRDYGFSWGNEKYQEAGKIGEYKNRVLFNQLGVSRAFTFRFTFTDPIKWIVKGCRADIEMSKD